MNATAIILAAGLSTRMKSALPKALHPIAQRSMLRHLILSCEAVFDRLVVVIGPGMEAVAKEAAPHPIIVQEEPRGTAHAALAAASEFGSGEVAILYVDNPLLTPATLARLLARRKAAGAALALIAMRPPQPSQYGRVILAGEMVLRIVEWADASEAERAVPWCSAGALCAAAAGLRRWLAQVRNDNAKGELYLTDVVGLAAAEGARVLAVEASFEEACGINTRAELAQAEETIQARLREAAMEAGVTLVAPNTVFLAADTELGADVTVGPHVVFGPGVSVASGAEIRAFCHLESCRVETGAIIGPFARLRPGTVVGERARVGNFVELKAAALGPGAKANHLSYLGDAVIGAEANIGAGTITCNYNGIGKYRTEIGAGAFIGSNTALIAPVCVGAGAMIGAGSTITRDVSPGALALSRPPQVEKPAAAARFRSARRKGIG